MPYNNYNLIRANIYYLLGSRHRVKYFIGIISINYHNSFMIEVVWIL